MPKHLVIVESPAKAKTINKYLGRDYLVKSSFGHIRDLPTGAESEGDPLAAARAARSTAKDPKAKKQSETQKLKAKAEKTRSALIRRMGVDPGNGWAARYEIVPGKEKVVRELREAAEKAETIWLASDLDREGEAIAWHLRETIGGDASKYRRVVFNEITKAAIQAAFAAPGALNMDRVNAQQARRFLDRVVGFQVSPLLWAKVARGLSAGRVQSVAVRLIVEREHEIDRFVPEEFWEVFADLTGAAAPLRAQVVRCAGAAFKPVTEAQASAAVADLTPASYVVATREDKPQRTWPAPPFITSTLQAGASTRLGFSVKKTMTLAQRLYEAGHITYMRTDSVNLSADALTAVRGYIVGQFGERYLPPQAVAYKSKAGAQEAHEAIRPTDVQLLASTLADQGVEADAVRLYDLIWRQFVACQMPPAEFDTTQVVIAATSAATNAGQGYELACRGRVLRFDGYQKVHPPAKTEDVELPPLRVGQALTLSKLDPVQHFTKPPPRYSEAGLVKELEKRGIGRPSTYAAIISTIQDRGYVRLENRRFFAEKLGDIVTSRLVESFPDLLDFGFTAGLEEDLDEVAEAKADWKETLDAFYAGFTSRLDQAAATMRPSLPVPTAIACATCGRPMAVRTARTGVFLGCTGYSLPPKERCTVTINLVPGEESQSIKPADAGSDGEEDQSSEEETRILRRKHRCKVCGAAMDAWLVDAERRLHVCSNNPDCPGTEIERGAFKLKGYDGPTLPCDKCGKPMQLKSGRFGKYFGCTGYPACANTRKLLRNGQAAPPKARPVPMPELPCAKGGHFVLRDGMLGLFLASNLYPKVRETRNPTVADLARHAAELDPKFAHLATAPQADPDGHPAIIRFDRETREHYLVSERPAEPAAKPTPEDAPPLKPTLSGWSMRYVDGVWAVQQAAPEAPRPRKPALARR